MKSFFALLFACLPFVAPAATIVTEAPSSPDPGKTYVFYLHGRIIEDMGPQPIDPRFGIYDYPAVLDALAAKGDVLIAAQRRSNTEVNEYAGQVVAQIERLIRQGVPPSHIVVIGFSKGGDIAVHVSSALRRPELRYVLLAACYHQAEEPQLRLSGHVLSIIESSDTLAGMSCKPYGELPERPVSLDEVRISTGRSHGAFYQPLRDWVEPALAWIHRGD